MQHIIDYVDQYGYAVLFLSLMFEMIAVPFPGEVLMSYSGFLVYSGKLNLFLSIFMAGTGTSIGITLSYFIGYKLGMPFFEKYGHRIHMGPAQLEKVSVWFSKYGNKLLAIAFFIPGVRHVTGYFSGITRLPFRTFALYAYSGAFFWVTTFIMIGKLLGPKWDQFHNSIKKYLIIAIIVIAFILLVVIVYRRNKETIRRATEQAVTKLIHKFHTKRKTVVVLIALGVVSLTFIVLMVGIIDDFLKSEYADFNDVVQLFIPLLFGANWTGLMHVLLFLSTFPFLIPLMVLVAGWILWKSQAKLSDMVALGLVVTGSVLYGEGIFKLFMSLRPAAALGSLPSRQSLLTFVLLGIAIYFFVKYSTSTWLHSLALLCFILLLVMISVSRVFFDMELPSASMAGYVFGGVWLSLNIVLIEVLRIIRE